MKEMAVVKVYHRNEVLAGRTTVKLRNGRSSYKTYKIFETLVYINILEIAILLSNTLAQNYYVFEECY